MVRIFNQYVSGKSLTLIALESVLIGLAVICSLRLRFYYSPEEFAFYSSLPDFPGQVLTIVLAFEVSFYYNELYDLTVVRSRGERFVRLGHALGAGCLGLGLLYIGLPGLMLGRGVFFISIALIAAATVGGRAMLDRAWTPTQNVLILGTGALAATVGRELAKRNDLNFRMVGFVSPRSCDHQADSKTWASGASIVGTTDEILELAAHHRATRIIVALEDYRGALPIRDLVRLRVQGTLVEDSQSALASLTGRVWISTVRPSWFVFSSGFRRSRLNAVLKRSLDLFCALAGLLLTAPIMLAVALAVRLDSSGPILYRQVRVGRKGRCITVLKFRSMRADAEKDGKPQWAKVSDPRVTRLGYYLRRFRLDELPQFINVIRGEMSFVGPRPERPDFVDRLREVIPFYDERHTVRPGLTGWAQVRYPYGASIEDAATKLEYDLFYLKNMSVFFDCAIVLQTARTVVLGAGR